MALVIAGERSGVGKTTITLALLSCLRHRGLKVQSFKVGPDYIDPMFHRFVTGRPCRNLDPILTSEAYVQQCFNRHIQTVDFALVEGVMGLFDGVAADSTPFPDFASTAHIARLLDLPILFVIDGSRLSSSVAAIAHGYRSFDPRLQLAGIVLNRVGSDRHLELLKAALEPLELPILGVFRRQELITIPDRHLGLVPTEELDNFNLVLDRLAELGATCFDWERLFPLLKVSSQRGSYGFESPQQEETLKRSVRIAVARDRAFSFYYPDNLEQLQQLGADLLFWSPLVDSQLPEGAQGLYFGGGFPEVFARELNDNVSARQAVQRAIATGIPTYAECGGLMYLCDAIVDFQGESWSMTGVLPTTAVMGKRLTLGYRKAVALQDSSLLIQGTEVRGHEFHRSHLTVASPTPLYQMQPYNPLSYPEPTQEGWQLKQVHASYLHLHWGSCSHLPIRFLQQCDRFPPVE